MKTPDKRKKTMKKYLREIEVSSVILLAIGVLLALTAGVRYGAWPCGVGLLLMGLTITYKAFHWTEYAAENKRNIIIMLLTIVILLLQMIWMK